MRALVLLASLAMAILTACSTTSGSVPGGASNAVVAAAQKTRGASSYAFDLSLSVDGSTFPSRGEYQAPDRIRTTSVGGPSGTVPTTTIVIGDARYSSPPRSDGRWTELTVPGAGMFDLVQVLDIAARATDATHSSDGAYAFSSRTCSGAEVQGTARLSHDGYLSEVHTAFTIDGHETVMDQSFSNFGAHVNIQPPDPSEVRSFGTTTPSATPGYLYPTATCIT